MGQEEISELERLATQSGLVAPINENQLRRKQDLFDAIKEWGRILGTKINEKTYSRLETVKFLYKNLKELLTLPQSKWDDERVTKTHRAYSIFANLLTQLQSPLTGMWAYQPKTREIMRGTQGQRFVCYLQFDPLTHENLHVYQHLLYDTLYKKGLLEKENVCPSRIIEPPQRGFQSKLPSYCWLKCFEREVIEKLIFSEGYKPKKPLFINFY